ncbi:MAG TPA: hypothetical protein VMM17_11440 [Gemmatimonadaceae bacterium]|nr:hypothetical protein [Gemmatimonadaceae bacterium]
MTRSLIAVTAGSVAAFLAYWFGAVVALIVMHGIPLGSAGGAPATADIAVHLGLTAIATFGGSRLAIRLGRTAPRAHGLAVGLVLAVGAVAAFGGASSSWPRWFGFAIAAASCAGAIAAVWWRTPAAPIQ